VLLVSADSPAASRRYREKRQLPFTCLADEDHRVADRFAIPIGRWHPMAWGYQDGFTQPAILAYRGDEGIYAYVAEPKLTNLYGASGRPSPEQVLEAIRPRLSATRSSS
jgi:hypothetical protein